MKKYLTIYADPPWQQKFCGKWDNHKMLPKLEYPTMSKKEILSLPISDIADTGCHLWLWTSNQFLRDGFDVMEAWGFKYLVPITWVKPSGIGNYFVHRTQTLLFGYKNKCKFSKDRYKPTVFFAGVPKRHSEKPSEFYDLVENISQPPYIELFARNKRDGWDSWGNEVTNDINLTVSPESER